MKILVDIKKEEIITFEVDLDDHVVNNHEDRTPGERTLEIVEIIQDLKYDTRQWLHEYEDSSRSEESVRILNIKALD